MNRHPSPRPLIRIIIVCVRSVFLSIVVGGSLLLPAPPGGVGAAAAPPAIGAMSVAELKHWIDDGRGDALVFFTAAWCGHCKEMLGPLNRLYHRFGGGGLRIVGISVDAGGAAAMQAVLAGNRVDFPVFWVGEEAVDAFRLMGIPMVFLVKNGRLVEKIPGKCSYVFLEAKILDLIK